VVILQAVLGLDADMPAGQLRLRPPAGMPLGAVSARGLRLAGQPFDVVLERGREPQATGLPAGVTVAAPVAPRQRQPESPSVIAP
jgi:hypothetical protein